MNPKPHAIKAESSRRERYKMAGILAFLVIAGVLMGTLNGFNAMEWMRWFLAGFLILFGSFKLINFEVFLRVFPLYDLIARRFKAYAYIYPLLQVFLGMICITGLMPQVRNIVLLLTAISAGIGMVRVIAKRGAIKLAYLGRLIRLRYSSVILLENSIIASAALLLLLGDLFLRSS